MPKRDFLSIPDFSRPELLALFDLAARMKRGDYRERPLAGSTLGMIFAKSSTRTRVSFEVGAYQLGGHALFLSSRDIQLGRGEPIRDTARVLSRYLDGIMIRTFAHADVEELARFATVPVINGLTDLLHPCQVLADLLTVREALGGWEGQDGRLGRRRQQHGQQLARRRRHAGLRAPARLPRGLRARPGHPRAQPGPHPDRAHRGSRGGGGRARTSSTPTSGPRWARRTSRRSARRAFQGYIVDAELMSSPRPGAIFLHCLPAHRGEEVTEEVLEGAAVAGVGPGGEPAARAEGADGDTDGSEQTEVQTGQRLLDGDERS